MVIMEKCIEFKELKLINRRCSNTIDDILYTLEENKDNSLPVRFKNCCIEGSDDYDFPYDDFDWGSNFNKMFKGRKIIFDNCFLSKCSFDKSAVKNIEMVNDTTCLHSYFLKNHLEGNHSTFSSCWFRECDLSKVKLCTFESYHKNNAEASYFESKLNYQNNLCIIEDVNDSRKIDSKKFGDYRLGYSNKVESYSLDALADTNKVYLFGQEELPQFMIANANVFKKSIKNSIVNFEGKAEDFIKIASNDLKMNVKALENCEYVHYVKSSKNPSLYYREMGDLAKEITKTFIKELKKNKEIKIDKDGNYVFVNKRKTNIVNKTNTASMEL